MRVTKKEIHSFFSYSAYHQRKGNEASDETQKYYAQRRPEQPPINPTTANGSVDPAARTNSS
jgi:hypothetical protein